MNDIAAARRAIEALAPSKYLRRYPAELRAQLVRLVRAHPEQSVGSLATAIDMAPKTLEGMLGSTPASLMVPVRVVAPAREGGPLCVHGRVESSSRGPTSTVSPR